MYFVYELLILRKYLDIFIQPVFRNDISTLKCKYAFCLHYKMKSSLPNDEI